MSEYFNEGQWYALYSSQALQPEGVRAISLLGNDIAVWREEEGKAHAWKNQCPHRGMRFSHGFVRNNRLACLYHGWQYEGTTGKCAYIPANPGLKAPKTACAHAFPCIEKQGLVWVSLEGSSSEEPNLSAFDSINAPIQFCRTFFINEIPERVRQILKRTVFLPFGFQKQDGELYTMKASQMDESAEGAIVQGSWYSGLDETPFTTITYQTSFQESGIILNQSRDSQGKQGWLIFALFPVNDDKTGIHLMFTGDHKGSQLMDAQMHYAQWGKRLRWFIENPKVPTTDYRPWI